VLGRNEPNTRCRRMILMMKTDRISFATMYLYIFLYRHTLSNS
jgi:hypothetical protein